METSLEHTGATAPAVPTAAGGADPVTVYLARPTSAESRRAMATSKAARLCAKAQQTQWP